MVVACEYPTCRETATFVVVIELGLLAGRSLFQRLLCDMHAEQAPTFAKQLDGIAYRLRRLA